MDKALRVYTSLASFAEIAIGATVELFLVAAGLGVLYRLWVSILLLPKRQVVRDFQRGVILRKGHVARTLDPGTYWLNPKRTLLLCDVRPTPFQVLGQELFSADGLAVRMSLGGEYRIVNPASFVTASTDSFGTFYLEIRQALRIAVGELTNDDFTSGQPQLAARMKELLTPRAAQLGVEVTQLDFWEASPVGRLRPI